MSVLPVNESDQYAGKVKIRNNALIQVLNHHLQVLSGVNYIDLYPLLLDEKGELAEDYTTDGLHLTQTAYDKIAQTIKTDL